MLHSRDRRQRAPVRNPLRAGFRDRRIGRSWPSLPVLARLAKRLPPASGEASRSRSRRRPRAGLWIGREAEAPRESAMHNTCVGTSSRSPAVPLARLCVATPDPAAREPWAVSARQCRFHATRDVSLARLGGAYFCFELAAIRSGSDGLAPASATEEESAVGAEGLRFDRMISLNAASTPTRGLRAMQDDALRSSRCSSGRESETPPPRRRQPIACGKSISRIQ